MRRPPVKTPAGFSFIGPASMQSGTFEGETSRLIGRLIGASDRFINVGANAGYYCAFAQQKGIPTIAFEPNPANFDLLQRNMQLNGWGARITSLPVAVGAESGFIRMYGEGTGASLVPGWAGNPMTQAKTVPVVTLDSLVRPPRPDETTFILMDVEGYEYPALLGATDLIRAAHKPIWMIEISLSIHQPDGQETNPNFAATLALFRDAGYIVFSTGDGLREADWSELLAMADRKGSLEMGDNFIFCAADQRALIENA